MNTIASPRDASIDVLRVACTLLVVALHATMAGLVVTGHEVVIVNALETEWFWPASWFVQIMPLFFLAGGVTAAGSWRRARARGDRGWEFGAARVRRLLTPGFVAIAAMAVGLAALAVVGVPDGLVAEAALRLSQPLWFLGVFILVQSLVPVMLSWHERRPLITFGALGLAAVGVDIARAATGIDGIGLLNLAFVWLLIQQLGFLLAGQVLARAPRRLRASVAAAALATAGILAVVGVYSPDMYVNLNPPTTALVLLAIAQLCLFSLAQPALRRAARHPAVGAVVAYVNPRAMAIYLWHMPAIILLSGALIAGALVTGIELAALYSPGWWASRAAWILAVAALTALLVRVAPVFRPTTRRGQAGPARARIGAVSGVVLAVASVGILFVGPAGLDQVVTSVALGAGALWLARRPEIVGVTPVRSAGQSDAVLLARAEG